MKKTLVIVDFQKDFCHPDGSLYVKGSQEAKKEIIQHIKADDSIEEIIFTLDWHPFNHCSFVDNGGEWPRHCVNYTEGAGIPEDLLAAAYAKTSNVVFSLKGTQSNKEEYGALCVPKNKTIEVCGIALDYCVKNTIFNLFVYNSNPIETDISLLKNMSPSIGEPSSVYDELEKLNITINDITYDHGL